MCIYFGRKIYRYFKEGSSSKTNRDDEEAKSTMGLEGTDQSPSSRCYKTRKGREKLSDFVVLGATFALALDFSIVTISIQAYWSILAPDKEDLYGFAFGIYDLAQFLFMPFLAYIADRLNIKLSFCLALAFNVIGNCIYALAYVAGDASYDTNGAYTVGKWEMILAGRFIAGIGSSALGLGVIYFTQVSTISERAEVMAILRGSQTIARTLGPNIALPLVAMDMNIHTTIEKVFNFYTIPGWIAAFVSLTMLILCIFAFDNPKEAVLENSDEEGEVEDVSSGPKSFTLKQNAFVIFFLQFVQTFIIMLVYSQLFGFAVAQYNLVHSSYDLWKIYMGFAAGALPAVYAIRHLSIGNIVRDTTFVQIALVLNMATNILLVEYSHPENYWLYYAATVLLVCVLIFFYSMLESFWTKKVSQFRASAGSRYGMWITTLNTAGALGRFLGPTVSGFALSLDQKSFPSTCPVDYDEAHGSNAQDYLNGFETPGASNYCPQIGDVCLLQYSQRYFNDGCRLANVNIVLPVCAGVTLLVFIYFKFFYLPYNEIPKILQKSTKNEMNETPDAPATSSDHLQKKEVQ
eukprot:Nk52_evm6s281 gene=Nk52_evmTU6s281